MASGLRLRQRSSPDRTEVRDRQGRWLATFTRGAQTVTLAGPGRRFAEGSAAVAHGTWVRSYVEPFAGQIRRDWLGDALAANEKDVPDILALALQYIGNAPPIVRQGRQIAGDAGYGPLKGGKRQEGADFNDYLGITWKYPGERVPIDRPEANQFRCLDCSGYLRMIFGYRHSMAGAGYPDRIGLCHDTRADHARLPRRAYQMYEGGPGVMLVPDNSIQVKDFSRLATGDLVFFNADRTAPDGDRIDHVGVYIGLDTAGRHRFISSRKSTDGPTLRDYGVTGGSVLDGTGTYAKAFRAVRRL